eukprot:SAG11_NODE_2126_length_3781_cov_80.824823_3_plen_180_part_00
MDTRIKNRSRMAYTLAELEVKLVDPAAQSVILDTDGFVCENKGGNVFCVKDGVLLTPDTTNALDGISRATAIELAGELGVEVVEKKLLPYDFATADEVFFTSTPYSIMPCTTFNGVAVGDGAMRRGNRFGALFPTRISLHARVQPISPLPRTRHTRTQHMHSRPRTQFTLTVPHGSQGE